MFNSFAKLPEGIVMYRFWDKMAKHHIAREKLFTHVTQRKSTYHDAKWSPEAMDIVYALKRQGRTIYGFGS